MRYLSRLDVKKKNCLTLIGATFIFIVLCCLMFSACEGSPSINGNGSNNGNNNCNGVNTCNNFNTPGSGATQPQSGSSDPIAEGDFLYNPGAVSGPAIVEYWNGQGGASKICGTFELPSGESFNYNAGHWWEYASDRDMQAQWAEHVALYQQKADNAGCAIGQRPNVVDTPQSNLSMVTDAPKTMNLHSSYTIQISLAVKGRTVTSDLSIEKSVVTSSNITTFGTPSTSLQNAFGSKLKPIGSATLVAVNSFQIAHISPEQVPLDQSKVDWTWSVYPLQTGPQFLTADVEVIWKDATQEKGPYRIAERTFQVNVTTTDIRTQDTFVSPGHLDIGAILTSLPSILLQTGGLGTVFIIWLVKPFSKQKKVKLQSSSKRKGHSR